jgi:hypothetical protein
MCLGGTSLGYLGHKVNSAVLDAVLWPLHWHHTCYANSTQGSFILFYQRIITWVLAFGLATMKGISAGHGFHVINGQSSRSSSQKIVFSWLLEVVIVPQSQAASFFTC